MVGAQRQPWVSRLNESFEPCKGYSRSGLTLSGLIAFLGFNPKVVASLQPWARISLRLRRIFNPSVQADVLATGTTRITLLGSRRITLFPLTRTQSAVSLSHPVQM